MWSHLTIPLTLPTASLSLHTQPINQGEGKVCGQGTLFYRRTLLILTGRYSLWIRGYVDTWIHFSIREIPHERWTKGFINESYETRPTVFSFKVSPEGPGDCVTILLISPGLRCHARAVGRMRVAASCQ